ncbi:MAG: hypothetical protein WC554_18805 [Clostridia bacterium]|jgi:hypothetical protein
MEENKKYLKIAALCSQIINAVRLVNGEDDLEIFDLLTEEEQKARARNVEIVINDPNMSQEAQHVEWLKCMHSLGWKWGEITDRKNKIHNCLVSYEDLPFLQKLKDHLFIQTVKFYKMEVDRNGCANW